MAEKREGEGRVVSSLQKFFFAAQIGMLRGEGRGRVEEMAKGYRETTSPQHPSGTKAGERGAVHGVGQTYRIPTQEYVKHGSRSAERVAAGRRRLPPASAVLRRHGDSAQRHAAQPVRQPRNASRYRR